MTPEFAILGQFGDAIEFIFESRESVSGGVQVGGPGEMVDLAANHLLVSFVALAAACALCIPLGLWLGHIGRGEFLAISVSNVGRAVPALVLLFFFLAYLGIGFTNVVAVLFLLTVLAVQVIPPAAVVVLMAPIALSTATALGLSPHLLLMTVALACSASFASPLSHPAQLLVMGPGGYRFADYVKLGLPLTLLTMAVVVGVLPLLWPG